MIGRREFIFAGVRPYRGRVLINLKTARMLNVKIPEATLIRADRVIE